MKKMRRLIPAFAMLMVAAIMLSTASFAWFTMGTTAQATGMKVTAEAASTLLIVNAAGQDDAATKFLGATNKAEFGQHNTDLIPATHDDDKAKYETLLKTVADTEAVAHATGAYNGEYVAVPENSNSPYYVDYVAYIASAGSEIQGKSLQVTVSADAFTETIHNAVTIDFWVSEATLGTEGKEAVALHYVGKINLLATQNNKDNNEDQVLNLGEMTVPVALKDGGEEGGKVINNYITVVMRVYYDGALKNETITEGDYYYVRNDQIPDDFVGFSVDFAMVTPPAVTPAG